MLRVHCPSQCLNSSAEAWEVLTCPTNTDTLQHGATGSTSLFDPEGFPRGDIDVVSVPSLHIRRTQLQDGQGTNFQRHPHAFPPLHTSLCHLLTYYNIVHYPTYSSGACQIKHGPKYSQRPLSSSARSCFLSAIHFRIVRFFRFIRTTRVERHCSARYSRRHSEWRRIRRQSAQLPRTFQWTRTGS